ncbi:MAG: CBS domain-containing protein [archaeon]
MATSRISVRDAMTRKVITVTPGDNVSDAAKLMVKHELGGLVVLTGGEPVGIVTERDLLDVLANDKLPSKIKILEVMAKPLITISPDDSIMDAAKTMQKNKIRKLPVQENGELIGILSAEDIVRIAPREIELLLELAAIKAQDTSGFLQSGTEGDCEVCGNYAEYLEQVGDAHVCQDCKASDEEGK